MIQSRFFRRHFLIASALILTVVVLGLLTSYVVDTIARPEVERRSPPALYARLVHRLGNGDPVAGVRAIQDLVGPASSLRLTLLGPDGEVLYPEGAALSLPEFSLEELDQPFAGTVVRPPSPPLDFFTKFRLHGRPGRRANPDRPRPASITRLPGDEARYLVVQFERDRPPPGGFFLSPFVALFVSVLLGTGLAMLLFYRSLREKAELADQVISELQRGNLKARFPIKKPDEIGQAMMRFNRMADEIERLVEHLRSVEHSRIALLQELAHDLRTPIASLKNLVETLHSKRKALDEKTSEELLTLSLSEIEYFERLVEDLLLLARVSEPRYRVSADSLVVHDVLEDEVSARAAIQKLKERGIELRLEVSPSGGEVMGDAHLLRRLFRNAVDNACSFAHHEVRVTAHPAAAGRYEIVIEDDGPGFKPEVLAHFGDRRVSRAVLPQKDGRVSVGLGSVIMKTVTQIHGGTLKAENRPSGGARVTISLPLSRT